MFVSCLILSRPSDAWGTVPDYTLHLSQVGGAVAVGLTSGKLTEKGSLGCHVVERNSGRSIPAAFEPRLLPCRWKDVILGSNYVRLCEIQMSNWVKVA